jgi:phage/plasmid-like protein (TIGR03299 family)
MNTQELLEKSKTDWTVSKRPLFGPNGEPTDGFGVFRDDNDHCLGLVKGKYTITQNHEIAELLQEAAAVVNINAVRGGTLGNGQKIYYQFELPRVDIGGSTNLRYLTGLSGNDGLTKTAFGATNVVVICTNTFFKALSDCESVKHTPNHKAKLDQIINNLKQSLSSEESLIDRMITLSTTSIPAKVTDDFILEMLGGNIDTTRTQNRVTGFREAIATEFNTHGETAYGLFNAVTRFTNHVMKYTDVDAKRKALMFGAAARINDRAFDVIESTYVKNSRSGIYHMAD